LYAALMVAVCSALMFAAFAVNIALISPDEIGRVAGTATATLLLVSATAIPDSGAGFVRTTVHDVVPPPSRVVGLHVSPATCTSGVTVSAADLDDAL
jgi:hypothetical protein